MTDSSKLTTVCDFNIFHWFVTRTAGVTLNWVKDTHSINDLSKHDMFSVKVWCCDEAKEELGSICIWTCISHRKNSSAGMLGLKVFILEFVTIDTFSASAVSYCEVTSLSHEACDDSVKFATLEMKRFSTFSITFLSGAKSAEVFRSSRCFFTKLHSDSSSSFSTDWDVKKYFRHLNLDKDIFFTLLLL